MHIVGAIPELNVFVAAAVADAGGATQHPLTHTKRFFHRHTFGPLLFVATDDEGEETDVDVDRLVALMSGGIEAAD